jgi:hypothetical protein
MRKTLMKIAGIGLIGLALAGCSEYVRSRENEDGIRKLERKLVEQQVKHNLEADPSKPLKGLPTQEYSISESAPIQEQDSKIKRTLYVGDSVDFYNCYGDSITLYYCGRVSYETFSLAKFRDGFNYYFPTNSSRIRFDGHEFQVSGLSPESVTLDHSSCPKQRR